MPVVVDEAATGPVVDRLVIPHLGTLYGIERRGVAVWTPTVDAAVRVAYSKSALWYCAVCGVENRVHQCHRCTLRHKAEWQCCVSINLCAAQEGTRPLEQAARGHMWLAFSDAECHTLERHFAAGTHVVEVELYSPWAEAERPRRPRLAHVDFIHMIISMDVGTSGVINMLIRRQPTVVTGPERRFALEGLSAAATVAESAVSQNELAFCLIHAVFLARGFQRLLNFDGDSHSLHEVLRRALRITGTSSSMHKLHINAAALLSIICHTDKCHKGTDEDIYTPSGWAYDGKVLADILRNCDSASSVPLALHAAALYGDRASASTFYEHGSHRGIVPGRSMGLFNQYSRRETSVVFERLMLEDLRRRSPLDSITITRHLGGFYDGYTGDYVQMLRSTLIEAACCLREWITVGDPLLLGHPAGGPRRHYTDDDLLRIIRQFGNRALGERVYKVDCEDREVFLQLHRGTRLFKDAGGGNAPLAFGRYGTVMKPDDGRRLSQPSPVTRWDHLRGMLVGVRVSAADAFELMCTYREPNVPCPLASAQSRILATCRNKALTTTVEGWTNAEPFLSYKVVLCMYLMEDVQALSTLPFSTQNPIQRNFEAHKPFLFLLYAALRRLPGSLKRVIDMFHATDAASWPALVSLATTSLTVATPIRVHTSLDVIRRGGPRRMVRLCKAPVCDLTPFSADGENIFVLDAPVDLTIPLRQSQREVICATCAPSAFTFVDTRYCE